MLSNIIREALDNRFDGGAHDDVMRFSIPHAHEYKDFEKIKADLLAEGCYIHPIFIVREKHFTAQSVMRRDSTQAITSKKHYERMREMVKAMMLFEHNYEFITYEGFVSSESFRKWFFEKRLKLPYPKSFDIYNANDKYIYGETQ